MKRTTLLLTTLLASISMGAMANEKSFSDVDKDGDQNVSQQELQDAGKDIQISDADQDNDGVLSKDEYEQAKEKMKQDKGGQSQQDPQGQDSQSQQ